VSLLRREAVQPAPRQKGARRPSRRVGLRRLSRPPSRWSTSGRWILKGSRGGAAPSSGWGRAGPRRITRRNQNSAKGRI